MMEDFSKMSHSDSEIRDDVMDKVRRLKKQLHIEFKAKRKLTTAEDIRKFKRKIQPLYNEIRLVQAVNSHNTEEVKKFLECGVSANSTDNEKRSALHVAVSKGYADIVELLLHHGADPNKRDIIHNTPLHLAACIHNFAIISMLINAKADVSCLDLQGRSPFHLASSKLQILQKGWREGAIEMIKLREELQQVVDLLMSVVMRGVEEKVEKLLHSDINELQMTKMNLNSAKPEELDNQMSKLLSDIEKFSIA
ncbi:unnamed protein product [Acanthoscelides obtectus]|uniref:Ankyrin repeat domain-containing protein 54 n=1 Tax=Acanthoscelides obtectus TaxID=200917 RepID=A0A9P0PMV3_ACAOB|nr:unnamed protein product [Acanthoscelides obtectus]CAK1669804.1 Ankyrin repeat domain-containing protein 54 [Acanthoscelides obtectus]